MTVKVTLTLFIDEKNDPDFKELAENMYDGSTKNLFTADDKVADDYMEDKIQRHFRPYGYKYTTNHNFKYQIIDKPFKEIKDDIWYGR